MASDLSDNELLRRYVLEGAEAEFKTLVERHVGMVYSAAFRQVNDPALAQDVTQKVFVALARRAVWLTGHPSLAGWLYRTAIHYACHEYRANQRRRHREQLALELGTTMKADSSALADLTSVLDEALIELRPADREALVLRFFARKSLREVGEALGVREDAAQKRVAKALDALAKAFRRRGFRIAGTAAVVLVLQQASVGAVPAGLAASACSAALSAGLSFPLGAIASPLLKIVNMTKVQTAALCVAVAIVPVSYEWNAASQAAQTSEELARQLDGLRADTLRREQDQARAETEVAGLRRRLALPSVGQSNVATIAQEENLFAWNEQSPYLRLPKPLLPRLQFGEFAARPGRDGKIEVYQLPSMTVDGTPSPALEAALGLSGQESDWLRRLSRSTFGELHRLIETHSQWEEKPFGNQGKAIEMNTAAFKEEGTRLRDQFRQQLESTLGSERAEAFWHQAEPVFRDTLNDFGYYKRSLQLVTSGPEGPITLFDHYRNEGHARQLNELKGRPLLPTLQVHADAWQKEINAHRLQSQNP